MTIKSAQIAVTFKSVQADPNSLGVDAPFLVQKIVDFANGVAAGQADQVYRAKVTIAASGTADLDLAGTMKDIFGTAVVGVKLKGIMIVADPGNTNKVLVGGATSNQVPFLGDVSDKVAVPPGGVFALFAPALAGLATITASTGDALGLANSGGTTGVTFDIVLVMASA